MEVVIRVEGTVEGFNQTAFAEHLANFLGVPVANVQISVVPSSILVTATILVPSGASTTSVTSSSTTILERLRSLDSATASQILQVAVLSIAPPTITSTATDMNAATRAALPEAATPDSNNTRITSIAAAAGAAAAVFCAVLLICGWCRFRRRRRKEGAGATHEFSVHQRSVTGGMEPATRPATKTPVFVELPNTSMRSPQTTPQATQRAASALKKEGASTAPPKRVARSTMIQI